MYDKNTANPRTANNFILNIKSRNTFYLHGLIFNRVWIFGAKSLPEPKRCYCQLNPQGQIPMKFESKYVSFIKMYWKMPYGACPYFLNGERRWTRTSLQRIQTLSFTWLISKKCWEKRFNTYFSLNTPIYYLSEFGIMSCMLSTFHVPSRIVANVSELSFLSH